MSKKKIENKIPCIQAQWYELKYSEILAIPSFLKKNLEFSFCVCLSLNLNSTAEWNQFF